jgi:hypothetical protein
MIDFNDPIFGQRLMLTFVVIFSVVFLWGGLAYIKPFTRERWKL